MAWRAFLAAAIALVGSSAWARTAADLEIIASPGVDVRSASVQRAGQGVLISGSVCRDGFSAGRPRFVRLDRVTAAGATVETVWAALRAPPGYRGGCAPYLIGSSALQRGERARLSVHRSRH